MNKGKVYRNICLVHEVGNAIEFIKKGICEIKNSNIEIGESIIPLQLLATGFERLMKCILCARYLHVHGEYPDIKFLKKDMGHDLESLLKNIREECKEMQYDVRSATKQDMDFLTTDDKLLKMNQLLSEFGAGARYYYLDIVTKGESEYAEPMEKIEEIEKLIVSYNPHLKKIMMDPTKTEGFNEELDRQLIIILEKFARALVRMFTLGELGKEGQRNYAHITVFLNLMDSDLGQSNYC